MEEFHGLTLKRKGADELELFDVGGDDRSGFPLSCRATKMRRLASPDGHHHQNAPAVDGVVTTTGQDDVPMGDAPEPAPGARGGEETAMVLYGDAARSVPRLRPWYSLRAGADWVRAMLQEADRRTVRELLSGAHEQDAEMALAVVPWVAPSPAEETEPSTPSEAADGGDSEGAAAMDVEEDEDQGRRWTSQAYGSSGTGYGEGYAYRWPQHCMLPPQLPTVGQASPVTWSW